MLQMRMNHSIVLRLKGVYHTYNVPVLLVGKVPYKALFRLCLELYYQHYYLQLSLHVDYPDSYTGVGREGGCG